MDFFRNLRDRIFAFLETHPYWRLRYLGIARWFATNGMRPPLTGGTRVFLNNWINQSLEDGCYNPALYEKEDRSLPLLFQDVLPHLSKESEILEVGCNCGRSLNYLYERGFTKLHGIEIGQAAVDHMKTIFPQVYSTARIEVGSAPDVLLRHPSKAYDLVFCHSVLVNIPAEFNSVFYDMARVSRRFIVTIENEGSWKSYPRDFKKLFEAQGFKQIAYKMLVAEEDGGVGLPLKWNPHIELGNNVLRVFVRE